VNDCGFPHTARHSLRPPIPRPPETKHLSPSLPPVCLLLPIQYSCVSISRGHISPTSGGYMRHAARFSAAPAPASHSLTVPDCHQHQRCASSTHHSSLVTDHCALLIAGAIILKSHLTPSLATPSAFLIAGVWTPLHSLGVRVDAVPEFPACEFLIGTANLLKIELTSSQQARKHFLIGTIRTVFSFSRPRPPQFQLPPNLPATGCIPIRPCASIRASAGS